MARKKSLTPLQQEYYRTRKRAQNLVSSYRRRYGEVDMKIPAIPKRITQASIRRLSSITPARVQKKTYAVDEETGEVLRLSTTLKRGIKVVRFDKKPHYQESLNQSFKERIENPPREDISNAYIPSYADIVLTGFYNTVSTYPGEVRALVLKWFKTIKAKLGDDTDKLYDMLEESKSAGLWLTTQEAYQGEKIYENLTRMISMLDISAGEKNSILQELDMENDFNYEMFD